MANKNKKGEWKTPSGDWRNPKYIPEKYRRKDVIVTRAFKVIERAEKLLDKLNCDLARWTLAYTDWLIKKNVVLMDDWKGNLNITSFDGTKRIQIKQNEVIEHDEEIQLATQLISEVIHERTESMPDIRAIIDEILRTNRNNQYSKSNLLKLKNIKIDDERWIKALDLIWQSMEVVARKQYTMFQRKNKKGKFETVKLNIHER